MNVESRAVFRVIGMIGLALYLFVSALKTTMSVLHIEGGQHTSFLLWSGIVVIATLIMVVKLSVLSFILDNA